MLKHIKKSLAVFVLSCFIATSANAIFPLVAGVIWVGNYLAANATVAMAVEASVYVHAGVFLAYELFYAEKGSDGKPTGRPAMSIKLSPNAARENPDPTKFDNPLPGARDVTPKASIPSSDSAASNQAGAANGDTKFWGNTSMGTGSKLVQGVDVEAVGKAILNYDDHSTFADIDPSTIGPTYFYSAITISASGANPTTYTLSRSLRDSARPTLSWPRSASFKGGSTYPSSTPFYTAPAPQSCPNGYALNSSTSSCNLIDPSVVKKPSNWPCEILRTTTGLQVDRANPNCVGVNLAGNSISPAADTSVSFNADGSVSVANPNGHTTFQLGSPNPDGSVPVTGATRSGNPSSYTPGSSTSSPSACGGIGQQPCAGTGVSTVGGASCGGLGQPACAVTVAGFDGLSDPTSAGKTALDLAATDRSNSLVNQTNKSSFLNILSDWVPKPQVSAKCEPMVIQFMRASISWDFCKYLPLLTQVMGYFFYIFSGMYIWKSFMNSNTQKGY